jgi:hypothetical protein
MEAPQPLDLPALAAELRQAIVVKDRKTGFLFSSFPHEKCFKGSDAVEWFKRSKKAATEADAVLLGSLLLAEGLVLSLTEQPPSFKSDRALYRFREDAHSHGQVAAGGSLWSSYAAQLFGGAGAAGAAGTGAGAVEGSLLPNLPWESKALRGSVADLALEATALGIAPLDCAHNIRLLEHVHPQPGEDPAGGVYNLLVRGE